MLEFREKLKKNKTPAELFFHKKLIELVSKQQKKYRFSLVITQAIIGWYIVDFLLPHKHLIIELDGSQHYTIDGRTDDFLRDSYLKRIGFDVLRYSNKYMFSNINKIIEYIDLWACLENPIENMFQCKKIIRRHQYQKEHEWLNRPVRSNDFKSNDLKRNFQTE